MRNSMEFLGQLIDQLELDTCGETVLEHVCARGYAEA